MQSMPAFLGHHIKNFDLKYCKDNGHAYLISTGSTHGELGGVKKVKSWLVGGQSAMTSIKVTVSPSFKGVWC